MNTAINFAPILNDLLKIVIMTVALLAISEVRKFSFVKRNTALSDNLSKLVWDAAHFAMAQEPVALTRYIGSGTIRTDDPLVATAVNWLIKSASTEIEALSLSPDDLVAAVSAILPQAKAALTPSLPAPTKE